VGYTTAQFGKWHLSSDEDLEALGCPASASNQAACSYAIQQNSVKAAGFDAAEVGSDR